MNINQTYCSVNDLISSNPYNNLQSGRSNGSNGIPSHPSLDYRIGNAQARIPTYKQPVEKNHMIIVDSGTRLIGAETMWNFRIKFNPSETTLSKVPVYENSPTLPQSDAQKKLGVYGDQNTGYDNTLPQGNLLGYDTIYYNGERGCTIRKRYRNVIVFDVYMMEIPSRVLDEYAVSLHTILLEIQELSGFCSVKTSSGTNENVAHVLVYESTTPTSVLYKSIAPLYFAVPTNQLQVLNIRAKLPFMVVDNPIDMFTVSRIESVSDTNGDTLNIYGSIPSAFLAGDRIVFDETLITQESIPDGGNIHSANDFLREQSHVILTVEETYIVLQSDSSITNLSTESSYDLSLYNENARVVNQNLQIQYILRLRTKEDV